jgi:hypothetical protein
MVDPLILCRRPRKRSPGVWPIPVAPGIRLLLAAACILPGPGVRDLGDIIPCTPSLGQLGLFFRGTANCRLAPRIKEPNAVEGALRPSARPGGGRTVGGEHVRIASSGGRTPITTF